MSGQARVLVALTPLAEDAIEQALFASEADFAIAASVAEADELETAALEASVDAVLLSPDLSGLTAGHCARLRALGARLVAVQLDEIGRGQLATLGVDATVGVDVTAAELSAALAAPAERAAARTALPGAASAVRQGDHGTRGNVVAVVGAKGAPGSSECAASLAALAADRWATVLVELDALGGALDLRLDANPHEGSLIAAVRAAGDERAVGELLERWLVRRAGWPPVLLGPPEPQRLLAELAAPGAIRDVLSALARTFALVVCDLGWPLGGNETGHAHRDALVSADAVLLVLGARDEQLRAGLAQLDRILNELEVPAERLRIVLNGAGGPGATSKATLAQTVQRQLGERGLSLDAILPWDGRALSRAQRKGLPLARSSRRGGYTRSLARLLDEVFLPTEPAPRRRKLKLAIPAKPQLGEEVPLPWRS